LKHFRGPAFNFKEEMRIFGDRFYVASRRRRKERFLGLIRQVKFYTGLSIPDMICKSDKKNFYPNLAELGPTKPTNRPFPVIRFEVDSPKHVSCSSNVKGHMLYGRDSKISVCDGQGWISITKGNVYEQINGS